MTRFFLLVLFLSLHFSLKAQVAIEWQNTIGGNNTDQLYSVHQTSDGGFISAGHSLSSISGDKTESNLGANDYWIVKLDAEGFIKWQNTIGGVGSDDLHSIVPTSDGGYVCGGTSNSGISGDKTENSQGNDDYWVVKLDSLGNIQWQNTIGGSGIDELHTISQTSDGGYICGGHSISNISGDKTENSQGFLDYWIIKLDSTGNIQWQNTIGGWEDDHLYSLVQTSDGGFICGGNSYSNNSGDKTENSNGLNDYWVVKLDSLGNIQWQNTIGGDLAEYISSVAQTGEGGYICGGHSGSNISGDKTESNYGMHDYWVVKLDDTGTIQWQKTIGGSDNEYFESLDWTADGGYICGGFSISDISGNKTENNIGNYDYWVVKLDSVGNIQWQNAIGGNGIDFLYSISQSLDGDYICGGYSASNYSGDKTENSQGGTDYWVVKLTENFNSIQGKSFADLNSNMMYDVGEPLISGIVMVELNTGTLGISQNDGSYVVAILDTGNYSVYPITTFIHYTATPITHTAYFSSMLQTDFLNDFAFQPNGVINDLQITLTPTSPFRPGFNGNYNLHYKNVGTTSLTGTVIYYPNSNVSYVSSSVTPTLITPDSVVWQTALLNPFDEGNILVTVNVNVSVTIGSLVNSCSKIEPLTGDAETSNNQSCWEVTVTGSYDPNDILVTRATITTTELLTPPYLEYIIRFQNTGTDTAFTVKVLNPVDTSKLQLNTFELVTTSHPANVTWKAWERNMEFQFDNILLPDSNVNEPLSHGFIRYRIKPKSTLAVGDSIKNNAYIYFDFNNPVPTNTAVTEIILPTFVNSVDEGVDFTIAPNPTSSDVAISFMLKRDAKVEVEIFNAMGQEVLGETGNFSSGKKAINISTTNFPKGIYYLKVAVEGSVGVRKMVRM
jgi:hypothetical protein